MMVLYAGGFMQVHHPKRSRVSRTIISIGAGLGLLVWVMLLISPFGSVVAAFTIFCLIGVLFVLGFVDVKEDEFRE